MVLDEITANTRFEQEKSLRSHYGDNSLEGMTLEEWALKNNIVIQ